MPVSDKDREAAEVVLCGTPMVWGRSCEDPSGWATASPGEARRAVDALIALDWEPRATVTRDAIVDHVARLEVPPAPVVDGVLTVNAESMADALIPFLRECGMEVVSE